MTRLRTPHSKPVIGYNEETGFTMAGKRTHIDPDTAWEMWHEGMAEVTKQAREQLKLEVEDGH